MPAKAEVRRANGPHVRFGQPGLRAKVDALNDVGKGPGATSIPLEVAPFTLVGATTRSGALPGPLRARFGFVAHMDFYDPSEH